MTKRKYLQVVITGGSKGLGYALADHFLSLGDHVIIAARTSSSCEAAARKLQHQHPQQHIFQTTCDVSQSEQVQQLAAFAKGKLGQVDIWINNAGASQIPKTVLADTAAEEVQQIVQTNMTGTLFSSQAAVQVMREQTTGEHSVDLHRAACEHTSRTTFPLAQAGSMASINRRGRSRPGMMSVCIMITCPTHTQGTSICRRQGLPDRWSRVKRHGHAKLSNLWRHKGCHATAAEKLGC